MAVDSGQSGRAAEAVKSCCAAAYQSDAVALILGDSYHPGGLALTRRLADVLRLRDGQRVLDVAAGTGTSALLLAEEFGVRVDGVDLGERSVATATRAADNAGLADRVRFRVGDAERIPFPDNTFDAVVCECAFCTFPDKATAATELARVLKPGGRLGITDVTVAPGGLPPELAGLTGWVVCLADARPVDEYAAMLAAAGLRATARETHNEALARMVTQIDARLRAYRLMRLPALSDVDIDHALELTAQAARAVATGSAGYALLIAEKPA
ncbi:methyltransferase domain-containing protein [Asanoa sp. NPDC049518]|uniref:class I SAM-dependent methyltransferase n=1 Tax=unclassified Asanoa TaxID=2685164 RepID=UPI003446CE1A